MIPRNDSFIVAYIVFRCIKSVIAFYSNKAKIIYSEKQSKKALKWFLKVEVCMEDFASYL